MMSRFGSVPAHSLADAVEKHVAKMHDGELTALLGGVETMPDDALRAFVASIFNAFRDRGESSDDVAEAARTHVESIECGDRTAIHALVAYASENTALLKEAVTLFAHDHGPHIGALPPALTDRILERPRVP